MFLLLGVSQAVFSQGRISFNNQQLFLNGMNVAYLSFASDIGPGSTDFAEFQTMFNAIRDNGGNSMRLWLHTTGEYTPAFDSDGIVTGPGTNAISDLRAILDMAWERRIGLILCLWSFDMLDNARGTTVTNRSMLMLTDTSATSAYINNALIPIVEALRGHPGIVSWEVFNEAEGMSNEFGWDGFRHVPMRSIQRFVNRVAGAIHRADRSAQVTTGAWSFLALSDVTPPGSIVDLPNPDQSLAPLSQEAIELEFESVYGFQQSADTILSRFQVAANTNYYRDDRLISAGGDPDGTLDFYTVHYYDWAGTALSPFHHSYSTWGLTKPLVVAEFYLNDTYGVPYADMFKVLYNSGYAGAMTWQWVNAGTQVARTKGVMKELADLHGSDIALSVEQLAGAIPSKYELTQNYPNPFNPSTSIDFSIPQSGYVRLGVFDMLGREVETLVNGEYESGTYSVTWNASRYASGAYVYLLQSGDFTATKKMMIVK